MKKKIISLITAVSAFLYTSYLNPLSAAEIKSVNYGTDDNMIFGEKGIALINVSDEFGNSVDEAVFYLNGNGEKLALWTGNDRRTFNKLYGNVSLIDDSSYVTVYGEQLPDFVGDKGFTRTFEVKTGERSTTVIHPDGMGYFKYGNTLKAASKYIFYGETEKTIPVDSFGVYADEKWKTRPVEWFFTIGEYEDPADNYSTYISKQEFLFNKIAGSFDIRRMAEGEYPYRMGYRAKRGGGGSGNIHNKLKFEDPAKNELEGKKTAYEYTRKTINLHEIYPSYFNEDGTSTKEAFGEERRFSFAEDSTDPLQTAGLIFKSGNLITAPIPDSEGNVTLFVDKDNYYFVMMTDFGWETGGGGGTSGMGGYADEKAEFEFNTVVIPETSVPVRLSDEGEYTVTTENIPEKYNPASASFSITNKDGSGVPECNVVLKYKRFSLDVEETPGGTLKAASDFTDDMSAVPVESDVKITAVPDEGYRLKNVVFSLESGTETSSNLLSVASEDSFSMPYTNVKLIPQFGEIVKGDIDGDDAINAADMLNMLKIILNKENSYNNSCIEAADINGDGAVNVFDLIRIRRLIIGPFQSEEKAD